MQAEIKEINDFYDRMLKQSPCDGYVISDEDLERYRAKALTEVIDKFHKEKHELERIQQQESEWHGERGREDREAWYIEQYGRVLPDFYFGMPYQEYLDTHRWRAVRVMVLERDGYCCRYCKCTSGLQVHHLTYSHLYYEWDNLGDLATVCDRCHRAIHTIQ